jgi:outer membrane cobalamin receptor
MAYWGTKMALNPNRVRGSEAPAVSARPGSFFLLPAILFFSIAVPCQAQDSASGVATEDADEVIEEIVVTGTRIKRRDFNTPSPLTTVSNTDIAFTGQMTIEETLNQMPQVFPSYGRASNNPGTASAEVDLRGFGPGRSLVLLNGRRVAPSGTGNAVDLNNIPQFLIDRIEIITGGTSTVYGSDAIAGVVNFITQEDYSGLGIEAGLSMAEPGDAEPNQGMPKLMISISPTVITLPTDAVMSPFMPILLSANPCSPRTGNLLA